MNLPTYFILGTYLGQTEVIDSADTLDEANYLRHEYRIAFGRGWKIFVKEKHKIRRQWLKDQGW